MSYQPLYMHAAQRSKGPEATGAERGSRAQCWEQEQFSWGPILRACSEDSTRQGQGAIFRPVGRCPGRTPMAL